MSFRFTTLITKEGKFYVAECLELGVVSQGKSIEEAKKIFKKQLSYGEYDE
jgi:predicted RNase H-like HicB family nuclease